MCSISVFCQYGYGSEGCVILKGRGVEGQLMQLSGEGGVWGKGKGKER